MTVYTDSSALVKLYADEPGTTAVCDLWQSADCVAAAVVAYAEVMAALQRKRRELGQSMEEVSSIAARFKADWFTLLVVDFNESLFVVVDELLERQPLRGFDAIHLASAVELHGTLGADLVFAAADRRLLTAAAAEGLTTVDVSAEPQGA